MHHADASTGGAPVVTRSRHSYGETVARLQAAIAAAGSTVFAAIDQAAAATAAGLELRPTTLLVFGNPRGGTPLMAAQPLFALELPLKLLVWEDAAAVSVAYRRPSAAAAGYEFDAALAPTLAALDAALARLVAAIA